jgi:hypothetical protein
MRHTLLLLFSLLLPFSPLAPVARADEVILTNGRSIKGTVTQESEKEVVIEVGGRPVRVDRKLVKEVRRSSPPTVDPKAKAEAVRLAWNLSPKSKPRRYRSVVSFGSTGVVGRKALGSKETTIDFEVSCQAARRDDLTLELVLSRSREREVAEDGKETKADTQDKASKIDRGLIDQPILFRLSRRGELQELISVAGIKIAELKEKERRQLERGVGTYVIRLGLLGLCGEFPQRAIKPREITWSDSLYLPYGFGGDTQIDVDTTLERVSPGEVLLRQTGKVKILGMRKRMVRSSKVRGEVRFSRAGYLLQVRQTSTARMRWDVGGKPFDADTWIKVSIDLLR